MFHPFPDRIGQGRSVRHVHGDQAVLLPTVRVKLVQGVLQGGAVPGEQGDGGAFFGQGDGGGPADALCASTDQRVFAVHPVHHGSKVRGCRAAEEERNGLDTHNAVTNGE